MTGMQKQSRGHHTVPEFLLNGFSDADGRLAVVHLWPEPRVMRQRPSKVGVVNRLNSWRHPDGSWDDELEQGPVGRLDSLGGNIVKDLAAYAAGVELKEQLRLLDWTVEQRVPLHLMTAGLMVRGMGLAIASTSRLSRR
jgi:hypothetical protein